VKNFIVLLGPPGAGKGTQASALADKLALPHISSGNLFRENIQKQTELGLLADRYISRGELVSDEITNAMIRELLSRPDRHQGAVLDGYPRTIIQAQALSEMLNDLNGNVSAVPFINVPEEVLVERLAGRWTCQARGHIFHVKNNPPRQPGICDFDGSALYQREDDNVETVTRRIRVYFQQTQPLIDFYRQQGLLIEIDGAKSIDAVTSELMTALSHLVAT
jgi:adenylate kinase